MAAPAPFKVIGLCAAPFTPFTESRALDLPSIAAHVEELLAQGVLYAFVAGTTGEGVTMSVEERKAVLEAWIAASAGRLTIIAHVGSESIADVTALAAHAQAAGAAACAAHTPSFNKPFGLDGVVEFLARISAAAPKLPLYYYNIAVKTNVNIRCDKLLAAIDAEPSRVPTFRGVKFTDFDLHIFANCLAYKGGKYDILSGAWVVYAGGRERKEWGGGG